MSLHKTLLLSLVLAAGGAAACGHDSKPNTTMPSATGTDTNMPGPTPPGSPNGMPANGGSDVNSPSGAPNGSIINTQPDTSHDPNNQNPASASPSSSGSPTMTPTPPANPMPNHH